MPRKRKIKRRANLSGSIIKLKGNRRKPYCVRVTVGRDEDRKPIRKNIAYFETEPEASDFLDMYNLMRKKENRISITDQQAKFIDSDLFNSVKVVLDQQKSMLTFKDIFNILLEERYKYEKSYKSKISWFNNFEKLHDRNINDISLFDLQSLIDQKKEEGKKEGTLSHMKVIASDIFEYAVIHEYISRDMDFTSYIDTSIKDKTENTPKHTPFTINEIRQLINHDTIEAKTILIYIFTGCRPIELFEIDTNKIYLDIQNEDNGSKQIVSYMIAGSKTEAGKNRIIPIHPIIKPYIKELLLKHDDYLIIPNCQKQLANYRHYYFDKVMKELKQNHLPYDCRHTFSTLAKLNKVEEFARKRIMGHKSNNITDDVYTHTIINHLYNEICKIKV